MAAGIVDWAALGQVVVYSFAAALVLTMLFTSGVLALAGRDGDTPGTARRALGTLAFGACLALVALGLYVMFTSK